MTAYDDRLVSHPLFAQLTAAQSVIAELLRAGDERELDVIEAITRLERVTSYTQSILETADPQLTGGGLLDQIAATVGALGQEVSAYPSDGAIGHLANANAHADTLLDFVARLPRPAAVPAAGETQEAVTSFRRSISQHARHADAEIAALEERLAALAAAATAQEGKLQQQDARLDTVVAGFQQQFSQTEQQRQAEHNELISGSKTTIDQLAKTGQAEIAAVATKGEVDVAEAISAAEAATEAAVQKLSDRATALTTSLDKAGKDRIGKLDELLEKAIRTVGVIGNTGMTGGYKQTADAEKKAANRLRWLAVGALALAVISSTAFALFHGDDFNWQVFASKSFISVPLLVLAGYAARESAKHRREEQYARKVELQLASIDSYLIELPDTERHRIKAKLADRFFAETQFGLDGDPLPQAIPLPQ
jgi:hypothetical protein